MPANSSTNNTSSIGPPSIGMIGCGAIAEIYHLPALQHIAGIPDRLWLAEPNSNRLAEMREKFSSAGGVSDYRDLEGKVDGVIIATPPSSHYEICKFFLERGIHVLSEKPLTENFEEAAELVRIAEDNDAKLAVNQTRRFFPTYQKIRDLIAEGAIGELQSIKYHDGVEFDWPASSPHHFAPGAQGAWSDTGVHLLDTVCYWLNADQADGTDAETPKLVESLNDSHGGPEAMATVRLKHKQCDVEIKVSRLGRLMNGYKIVGSLGSIEASAEEFATVDVRLHNGGGKVHRVGSRKLKYVDFAKPLLENFIQVVAGKAEPIVSGASVVPTVKLLEEAYQAPQRYRMPWNDKIAALAEDWNLSADQPKLRVLVTGASGFVGGRVVECLLQSGIATPVAAIRSWSRAARVARFGSELVICDICDADQVDKAVAGVDAIIHLAKTDDRDSIVGGTRNLLDAAVKHGVDKFVFLSTAEVYGPEVPEEVTETQPRPKTGRLYGDAKVEAEELCGEYHDKGLRPTILRPSLIYGPFSTSWTTDFAKRLESGNWGTFDGHCNGKANLIHVDDLVQAIMRSLTCEAARGQAFNVNGPEVMSWNSYFQHFNDALGRKPLPKISATKSKLRTKVMDTFGFMADKVVDRFEDKLMEIYLQGGWPTKVMKRIKGTLNSTPSGNELNDLFARDVVYEDQKAHEVLGYEPNFDMNEGLRRSVEWLHLNEVLLESNPDTAEPHDSQDGHHANHSTGEQAEELVS